MQLFLSVVVSWTLLGYVRCESLTDRAFYQGCHNYTHRLGGGRLVFPFKGESCLKLCSGRGQKIAGLDSINSACYCGEGIMNHIVKTNSDLCKPCVDNSNLFCGENLKLSVYEIGPDIITTTVKTTSTTPNTAISTTTTMESIANNNSTKGKLTIEPVFDEDPVILLAGHAGIITYNNSHENVLHLVNITHHFDAMDYHLGRKQGFAIWNGTLYRFPLFEDSLAMDSLQTVRDVYRCLTFAVDWVHDKIYMPDCHFHYLYYLDVNTTNDEGDVHVITHLDDEGAWAMDMAVDPYKGLLFWTTGAVLWSIRLDGRGLTKVIPEFPVNRVSSISLDLAMERVYFFGQDKHDKNSSKVYYTSYQGALSHPLQYSEFEGGYGLLSLGIFNHNLYLIKKINENDTAILVSKIEYNHRPRIINAALFQPYRLRLVHPNLQAPGSVDACTHHNCSNMCDVTDSSPRCLCPRHYYLDVDQKTCLLGPDEEEESLLLNIVIGLMTVLFVVLGAGVLMCVCDKLWSQIHPSVVRLSSPGGVKQTFTSITMQDSERLI